jgi:hypothetical protein
MNAGALQSWSPNIIAAVRQLVLIANDDLIAGILNRNRPGDRPRQSLDMAARKPSRKNAASMRRPS